uniref:Sigma-70 family RNA polymerase sigma factor n=1 Tax=Schlesneria paludicola TaxID=360056 RepID=A0A7C4QS02_9PLAN
MSERVALAELIDRHYALVYRYAYRLSGSATDAEDLTQQTFLQAQAHWEQLRDPAAAKYWLCAITRNAYLRAKRNPVRPVSLDLAPEPCAPVYPEEIDPHALQTALQELPEEFRTPVILFYFQEFSYKDIAAHLNVPLGTVMSRLARAKEALRRRLVAEHGTTAVRRPPFPQLTRG